MYLTYFIRPPLCTAAGTERWKENQNVKTKTKAARPRPKIYKTKTEAGLRPVCHKIAVSDAKTDEGTSSPAYFRQVKRH